MDHRRLQKGSCFNHGIMGIGCASKNVTEEGTLVRSIHATVSASQVSRNGGKWLGRGAAPFGRGVGQGWLDRLKVAASAAWEEPRQWKILTYVSASIGREKSRWETARVLIQA